MYVPEEEKKIKKKAHGLIIGITVTDGWWEEKKEKEYVFCFKSLNDFVGYLKIKMKTELA